jgi:hypothetical protein
MPYLNIDLVKTRKLDLDEVERVAAQAASTQEHIGRVYTRRDLLAGEVQRGEIGRAFSLGFYGPRSGDLRILQNLTILPGAISNAPKKGQTNFIRLPKGASKTV